MSYQAMSKIAGPQDVQNNAKTKKAESAFRTISEVADDLDVQQHVLRFWETKFSQVRPLKRGGGRRYYRPEDVALLKKIHHLLYTEGYTIKGVQKLLKEVGKNKLITQNIVSSPRAQPASKHNEVHTVKSLNSSQKQVLESMLDELKELRALVLAD